MSYIHLPNHDLPSLFETWKPLDQRAEGPLKAGVCYLCTLTSVMLEK